jgi:hypothetical protein
MTPEIPYVQLFDFLEPDELEQLITHVAEQRDHLAPSTVYRAVPDLGVLDETTRRSRVAMDTDAIRPLFEARLMALLPHVRRELGMARFDFGHLETQLTVHGDGDFFTRHRDEVHPGTDGARALTFVFYFNATPREFEGGALRLGQRTSTETDDRIEIEPVSNSIVFFSPEVEHEVMPVRAVGSGPGSLRCTFNGWFRIGKGSGPAVPVLSRRAAVAVQEAVVPRMSSTGFTVRPIPPTVLERLAAALIHRRETAVSEGPVSEYFPAGAPDLIDIAPLGHEILLELQPWHEQWAGMALEPVAAYGVRSYRSGQRIAMHVDRGESHIVTSELQIEQSLDHPWPLRIRLGSSAMHEVHVQAGHMVTYEGAACGNGRPEPLRGTGCSSLLLHYRPVGWSLTAKDIVRRGGERGLIDARGEVDTDVVLAGR